MAELVMNVMTNMFLVYGAMEDALFTRHNVPLTIAHLYRPIKTEVVDRLIELARLYCEERWTDALTEELLQIREETSASARKLRTLLEKHGYEVLPDGVPRKNSIYGEVTVFTWECEDYEEYDSELVREKNEQIFLDEVMSGKYDDEYDRKYLEELYGPPATWEGLTILSA